MESARFAFSSGCRNRVPFGAGRLAHFGDLQRVVTPGKTAEVLRQEKNPQAAAIVPDM
jgi:hypothetical protein